MREYTVTWTIQVDGDSPLEAAETALGMLREGTTAWAFTVEDKDGHSVEVDFGHEF